MGCMHDTCNINKHVQQIGKLSEDAPKRESANNAR